MSTGNGAPADSASANGIHADDGKVRVAIVGDARPRQQLHPGRPVLRGRPVRRQVRSCTWTSAATVRDIEFVAAFDIDSEKVGRTSRRRSTCQADDTIKFADVPHLGVEVHRGTPLASASTSSRRSPRPPARRPTSWGSSRRPRRTCSSAISVGSEDATKWYVEQALAAGVGFVNCLPVFIAREDYWDGRFREAGLPIIGDDIKSQVGATIVHRQLARLFHDRGVQLEHTSQLNVGGNMNFFNMLERERLDSKKISKTNAVTSVMGTELPERDACRPVGLRAG